MFKIKLKYFLLYWVWQFPQKLLGELLIRLLKAEIKVYKDYGYPDTLEIFWFNFQRDTPFKKFISGASLADIILLSGNNGFDDTIKHEYGHSRQSLYWGWLYLPIIGIWSAVFCNLWDRLFHKNWCVYDRNYWYYKKRCLFEGQADRLGNVDRDLALAAIVRPDNAKYPAVKKGIQ